MGRRNDGVVGAVDTLDTLEAAEIWLEGIAVVLCWSLALGFCIKKKLKRRRRRLQQQKRESKSERTALVPESSSDTSFTMEAEGTEQKSFPEESNFWSRSVGRDEATPMDGCIAPSMIPVETGSHSTGQPCTVVSLTTLGFLDEISYFPTLILGGILTVWELILGTFVAGLLMLAIQVFLATQCKPWIEWLGRHVPLHAIIALFATLLTVHWVWDLMVNWKAMPLGA
jgi:hypothetical protein